MKNVPFLPVVLIALLCSFWLAGCSTKSKSPSMDEQSQIGATDISAQQDVTGVADQPIRSEDVPMHTDIAGLERIHFAFDEFTLSSEARDILKQNAQFLKANPSLKVVIEGHCDERGSDEYNLALGESRALAAKNYLISLGIDPNRLSVISYGEEKPLDPRSTDDAWAKNRRAEFKVVG